MRDKIAWPLAGLAALLLAGGFLALLLTYTQPIADGTYDLSVGWEGEAIPSDWVYDQKGWTVFTQEGETVTHLTPDGSGGFTGLSQPGQTVYFSRILREQVDSPALRLGVANRNVAVFLDDEVLYTDGPDLDNRVGQLTLPMLDWDRDPLTIPLPPDYEGKVLTIAQSTGEIPEIPTHTQTVTLCQVTLHCSYAEESGVVSESFQTAIPATLAFVLGLLGLGAFLWRGARGRWDGGMAVFSLMALSLMAALLCRTSFFPIYFRQVDADLNALCRAVSLSALLVFLGQRGGRRRWLLWGFAALHGGCALLGRTDAASPLTIVSEVAGLLGLLAAAGLGVLWAREKNRFYRLFAPAYLGLLAAGLLWAAARSLLDPAWGDHLWTQMQLSAQSGLWRFFVWRIAALAVAPAAVAAIVEVARQEGERRTEARMLLQHGALAQENYENLRSHSEQIMALRHDLRHHATALRGLCREGDLDRVAAYLDDLGSQIDADVSGGYTVHPAVNTVLTAMLARGKRLGIQPEVRVELPAQLPIPDSDLCALLMNLLENALEANEKIPQERERWLTVAIHIRGEYLYVGVENARFGAVDFDREARLFRSTKGDEAHGYGLRSAQAMARKYHSELRLEAAEGRFSASTALLLPQA